MIAPWMPSTIICWFAWRVGRAGQQLVARDEAGDGVRDPEAAELHARARRERRGVVAGDAAQDFRGARRVSARERDLGLEPALLARVGGRERRREIRDRGLGRVDLGALQPLARGREPVAH